MTLSNFSEEILAGKDKRFEEAALELAERYGFDFCAIGLTAFIGAPLKWVYGAGATSERYKRIVLAPGHGIGGIVIKAGKPMVFTDIDKDIDPREYSSYPIVFAEDLRSFCALPLRRKHKVVGALLCAFRTVDTEHSTVYQTLINDLDGNLLDLEVNTTDFLNLEGLFTTKDSEESESIMFRSDLSRVISAQEKERRRISRDLHDGTIQELMSVAFLLRQIDATMGKERASLIVEEALSNIDRILDELHNVTVELRPSALDNLGLMPALRSHALVLEQAYGAEIVFEGSLSRKRFNQELETQVYRICQEAIINACKYSASDRIYVELEDSDNWLRVTIADEGIGFNPDQPIIKGGGCGLAGMQERAHLIGADLKISSGKKGTKITMIAPMGVPESENV